MDEGVRGFEHTPVLLEEVVEWLTPGAAVLDVLVDCTVGGGGHSEALLDAVPVLRSIGIDRDEEALDAARVRLARFAGRVRLLKADFRDVSSIAREAGHESAGAVLFDLGVSSPQLDRAYRGFRYRGDAPLDMRMDRSAPLRAEDVVNTYSESRLAGIIARYGEERFARRVARAIAERRRRRTFTRAEDLAEVVREAIPAATRRRGPHPARRTFQAIRIEVNQELASLEASLPEAVGLLVPGGRIAVIAYHSLEDRIVKTTFAGLARGCRCPADLPICVCGRQADLRVLTRKPVRPDPSEVEANPRSRSARLRVAERLGTPEAA